MIELFVQSIITKGLGPQNLLVSQGYVTDSIPEFIPDVIESIVRKNGGSAAKRRSREEILDELEPIIVWAKMIELNNNAQSGSIKGSDKVIKTSKNKFLTAKIDFIKARVQNIREKVRVTGKLIMG